MKTFLGKKIRYDYKGYAVISVKNKEVKAHVLVWEKENGKKPVGFDIHHKDFNKANFSLSNLELLSKKDHCRLHAGWKRNSKKEWIKKPCSGCKKVLSLNLFYSVKTRGTLSALCKKCHCKRTNKCGF